ncbi:MAG: hypothetical protein CMQ29_09100 [Gammaproteobacteria bacterium]|nr:hypothetical protein [Gammaproteobacteria bacterium]
MGGKRKVIIDCDPGVDDAFAIALATCHLDIVGITSTFGNSLIEHTTHNALAIADALSLNCPIYQGASGPIAAGGKALTSHALDIHGDDGMGGARLISERKADGSDAAAFLADALAKPEVALIATGPLTNVAAALRMRPEIAHHLDMSLMGGASTIGNVNAVAEFNIYADPEAASEVFASGAVTTVAGLDITASFGLTEAEALRLDQGDQLARELANAARHYLGRQHKRFGRGYALMHDVCAVIPFIEPELIRYIDTHIAVECAGEHTRGMTVCDRRSPAVAKTPNVKFGIEADGPAIVELMLEAMAV